MQQAADFNEIRRLLFGILIITHRKGPQQKRDAIASLQPIIQLTG
jgi:hypothetical protein